jgi:hypothetical protein
MIPDISMVKRALLSSLLRRNFYCEGYIVKDTSEISLRGVEASTNNLLFKLKGLKAIA